MKQYKVTGWGRYSKDAGLRVNANSPAEAKTRLAAKLAALAPRTVFAPKSEWKANETIPAERV